MSKVIDLALKYQKMLISGVEITLTISIAAIIMGLILGIILAIMKTSRFRVFQKVAGVYVEAIRGTPVMIQLCICYYGAAIVGIDYPSFPIFDGAATSDRLIAAILGLGFNSAALICEIVRGGLLSVDYGQTEASLSLGMTNFDTLRKIVLPQAVITILPSLGNEFVNMIKTSSNVTIIGLADLMYVSNMIRGQSYRPFAPFVIVGVMYFVLTYVVSRLVKVYEKRINVSKAR